MRHSTVSILADSLRLISEEDALRIFHEEIGIGDAWESPLMQYRTTAEFQKDWRNEIGNWIEYAKRHGFWSQVKKVIVERRSDKGARAAGDDVHRNVVQQLAETMAVYYFAGIGWQFHRWNPEEFKPLNDVDFQLRSPRGNIINFQVKSSGRLGLPDSEVDSHIEKGIKKAAGQLPKEQQSVIIANAQRDWWLTSDIDVIESFVGSTCGYPDGSVVLPSDAHGELKDWSHVSAIVAMDLRRGPNLDYCCSVVLNPWARYPVEPSWFPYSRVLVCSNQRFEWIRGEPDSTTFPSGTALLFH